jgi:hypothetical protein
MPVEADVVALLEGAEPSVQEPPLAPDDEVAVKVWRQGPVAAVLYIWHDPDDDEEPFAQDIEVFERVDGRWQSFFRGGSDWPVAFGARPLLERPALTGYASGTPAHTGYHWIASGIAPPNVHRVKVTVDDHPYIVDVEPITGAFLVGLVTPSSARLDVFPELDSE